MAHRRNSAERGAAEGGVYLRHQLFKRVILRAKRDAEVAAETGGMAGGVPRFVQVRAMPVDRHEIGLRRRDHNEVRSRRVEGPVSTDAEIDAARVDQRLDLRLDQPWRRKRRGRCDGVGQVLALHRHGIVCPPTSEHHPHNREGCRDWTRAESQGSGQVALRKSAHLC